LGKDISEMGSKKMGFMSKRRGDSFPIKVYYS
jgi:hypothetical protein